MFIGSEPSNFEELHDPVAILVAGVIDRTKLCKIKEEQKGKCRPLTPHRPLRQIHSSPLLVGVQNLRKSSRNPVYILITE
jgi:hypothetical protein